MKVIEHIEAKGIGLFIETTIKNIRQNINRKRLGGLVESTANYLRDSNV